MNVQAKIVRKSEQENKLDDGNETGVERDRKKDKRKTSIANFAIKKRPGYSRREVG